MSEFYRPMNTDKRHLTEITWAHPIEVAIDFKRKHLISPERALIDCGLDDQNKHIKTPLGVVCYGYRRLGAKGDRHNWSVDPNTLIEARKPVISKLINWLCENQSHTSAATKLKLISYLRAIFNWLDDENLNIGGRSINFENVESLKTMYVDYTKHLKNLMLLKQTANTETLSQGITNYSAKVYQAAARKLVMACSELDEEIIKSWAEVLTSKINPYAVGQPTKDEEIRRFHSHIVEVIEAHFQIHVVKNQSVIHSEQWGWLTGSRTDFDKTGHHNTSKESHYNAFTLVAFYFMVLATGQNESVLLSLKVNQIELNRLNKTSYRVGIKKRAKGKEIIIEMGAEHKPIFEKYLAVINVIAPSFNKYLFPNCSSDSNKAVETAKKFSQLWEKALGGKVFRAQALRRFYSRKIGQIAQSLGSQSGDLNGIIACMLQNKPLTACQYSIESLEQAAQPLSHFLGELHEACIERSKTINKIKVQLKEQRDEDRSTPTGACANKEGQIPQLANGFTGDILQPSCGKWETCLFCDYYGVHADEIDLKKLLSLQVVIGVLHQGMDEGDYANRFAALLARIQDVIDVMLIKNLSLKFKAQGIRTACEAGDLDDFWAVYLRTLKLNGYQPRGKL